VVSLRNRRRRVFANGADGGFGVVVSIAFSPDDSQVLSRTKPARREQRGTASPVGVGVAVDAISRNATRILVEQNTQILVDRHP
jgi:hypothetical protein